MAKRAPRKPNVRRVTIVLDPRDVSDPRQLLEHLIAIAKVEEIRIESVPALVGPTENGRRSEQLEAKATERIEQSLEIQEARLSALNIAAASPEVGEPTEAVSVAMKQLKQSWYALGIEVAMKLVDYCRTGES